MKKKKKSIVSPPHGGDGGGVLCCCCGGACLFVVVVVVWRQKGRIKKAVYHYLFCHNFFCAVQTISLAIITL